MSAADRRPIATAFAALACVLPAACSSASTGAGPSTTSPSGSSTVATTATTTPTATTTTTTTTTTAAPTTTAATTTTTTVAPTTAPTTAASTTAAPTTAAPTTTLAPTTTQPAVPPIPVIDALSFPVNTEIEIGRSVEGRPITVVRRGVSGGTRVLVVGVIHGNEAAGVAIVDRLMTAPVPDGVELFLVRSMNPDGQARSDRQNANAVDLNRNFPERWDTLGVPGDWQYGGPGPASEPETQAMVALGNSVRPDLILWYHQDLFRIAPGSGRAGEIRTRYAHLAGLPIVDISGGTYTGTASQWSRTVIQPEGVGITVELGPTLGPAEIDAHIAAVFAVATEYW